MTDDELFQMMADDEEDWPRSWTIKARGPKGYTMVEWPHCQRYMDEEWFNDEAYLDLTGKYGDCAYWIPDEYLNKQMRRIAYWQEQAEEKP